MASHIGLSIIDDLLEMDMIDPDSPADFSSSSQLFDDGDVASQLSANELNGTETVKEADLVDDQTCEWDNSSSADSDSSTDDSESAPFVDLLSQWCLDYNICNSAIGKHLQILHPHFRGVVKLRDVAQVNMFIKQNAKAFSLNAIVDVRRRHHEMIFWEYL